MPVRNHTSFDDVPTTQLYISTVMDRAACAKHDAIATVPCYEYPSLETKRIHHGVCNSRAKRAGMRGEINPRSLLDRPVKTPRA